MMSSRRVAASVLVLSLFCLAASEADPDDNRFTGYANGSLITVAHTSFTQAGAVVAGGSAEPVPESVVCGLTGQEVAGAMGPRSVSRLCLPAAGGQEPVPVVVSASDVSSLLVGGSGLVRQPPGERVVVTRDLIVHTDPSPRTLATTVAGVPVNVTATPVSYTWHWGDGTSLTTTDPGAAYPHHTVVHRYRRCAQGVVVALTTSWRATYSVAGGQPQPVDGTITTTETSTPFDLVRLASVLTDDAEHAQGH